MAKAQQTTEAIKVTRIRPMWKVEAKKIELLNADFMYPEQLKYLKAYVGKEATSARLEKLKAAIIANEGELKKPEPPKKKAEPKEEQLSLEEIKEATKEVAPTKDKKVKLKDKAKSRDKEKADKVVDSKPNSKKTNNPRLSYDGNTVFNEGDIIPCGYNDKLSFKVLNPDAKPKVGQWAVIPDFMGDGDDEAHTLFLLINYFGQRTVWMIEPFETENMIPTGWEAFRGHYLDEEDENGKTVPEEEWVPFYLCEMVVEAVKPKEEKSAESIKNKVSKSTKDKANTIIDKHLEKGKAEEKPKDKSNKPKIKKNKNNKSA